MNVGGLFQYLNSEACLPYYATLDPQNRTEVIDQIMSDPVFLEAAQALVSDMAIIRQKLETKVGQMCKKMTEKAKVEAVVSEKAAAKPAVVVKPKEAPIVYVVEEEVEVDYPEFDEEKGKYIGSGFYLKREDHLMKLTSPEWTIYY